MQEKTLNEYIDEILTNGSCKVYYTTQEQKEGKRVVILKINDYFKQHNIKIIVTSNHISKDNYYDKVFIENIKELEKLKRRRKIEKIKTNI